MESISMGNQEAQNVNGEKGKGGRPTLFSQYLAKNPKLKQAIDIAKTKQDSDELEFSDIAGIEDLIEYACFELTRSKNENLLRGKTFTEYAKAFTSLYETKAKLELLKKEWELRQAMEARDRQEIETFISVVLEAISKRIDDINIRKALSEEIQKIYDLRYSDGRDKSEPEQGSDPKLLPPPPSGE